MRRLITLLLLASCLSVAACGKDDEVCIVNEVGNTVCGDTGEEQDAVDHLLKNFSDTPADTP